MPERLLDILRRDEVQELLKWLDATEHILDERDDEGSTLLCRAVSAGAIKCAEALLKSGASPDAGAPPPLSIAVSNLDRDSVRVLLLAGAQTTYEGFDPDYDCPLSVALGGASAELVSELVAATRESSSLSQWLEQALERYLDKPSSTQGLEIVPLLRFLERRFLAAHTWDIRSGVLDRLREWCESRVPDKEFKDSTGLLRTLSEAIAERSTVLAAQIDRILDLAAFGKLRETKAMLERIQGPDQEVLAGAALAAAIRMGEHELTDWLLSRPADMSAVDECGATALMWAAHSGSDALLRALLARGADPRAVNSKTGESVADYVRLSSDKKRARDRLEILGLTDSPRGWRALLR